MLRRTPRVLAIGAHPDDPELGAGGFIRRLVEECQAIVHFLVLTRGVQRAARGATYAPASRAREVHAAAEVLGVQRERVEVLEFSDCGLHLLGHELIRVIEDRLHGEDGKARFDIVLTHSGQDTHADHRAVHEATVSAARDFHGAVLCYQAPSTLPNGFRPTFFADISRTAERKIEACVAHASQREKAFMDAERIRCLAQYWAFAQRLPPGTFLEAFEVHKASF